MTFYTFEVGYGQDSLEKEDQQQLEWLNIYIQNK